MEVYRTHVVRVACRARRLVAVEAELVCDLDGLDKQQVVAWRRAGGTASSSSAEGLDGPQLSGGVLLVALHGLTAGHARCDERAELHHLAARELKRVEVRE